MVNFDLNKYNYFLPKNLIAEKPAAIRDHSRLFVYNTKEDKITFDYFYNLNLYLPSPSLIVFNTTKVLKARLYLKKETGGKLEALFLLDQLKEDNLFPFISNRKLKIGEKLYLENGKYFGEILNQEKNIFFLKFDFKKNVFLKLLNKYGKTPIPKYIKNTPLSEKELNLKYQSIFAKHPASIAAPTASLHFTKRVLKKLSSKGIKKAEITLNVGLGTFAPLKEENFLNNKLHQEFFNISSQAVKKIITAKKKKEPIIAVGTTTVRALESFARGKINATDLFIYPPFEFKIVDILITNFHLPKSSLLLLVDAFLKYKKSKRDIVDLYKIAIEEKFRFYSFGDAMLIL